MEMVRDCRHGTRDVQRLQTGYRRWSETADRIQEMVRDCRRYKRWSETGDMIQERVRDWRHDTREGQRLQT
ncbi:unnamed protein product [Staurois parvus]|uniref:Uncharacterized protein n=1 Tax=Staurois parvus TaxID=386267 RepID=A0ABN9DXD7_9NEOB|nr:unnamed protein product [Staurois parvus]